MVSFKGIRALFFDYGGTLDAPGIGWRPRFFQIYRSVGIDVGLEEFTRAFYKADDSLVAQDPKWMDLTQVVHRQVSMVLEELGCYSLKLENEISALFLRDSKEYIRSNIPLLKRLGSHFRLGIISNNYGNLQGICKETGLDKVFQLLVDSNRVGYEKPHPGIFLAGLKGLGVAPQEAVMIGDNYKRDIEGARAVGMEAVLVSPDKNGGREGLHDLVVISDICQLGRIFG